MSRTVSGQTALLGWVNKTLDERLPNGIPRPPVTNFTSSWASGHAFCALACAVLPNDGLWEKFRFESPDTTIASLALAARELESGLGVTKLFDPEDWLTPDRNSVMTYVSEVRKRSAAAPKGEKVTVVEQEQEEEESEEQISVFRLSPVPSSGGGGADTHSELLARISSLERQLREAQQQQQRPVSPASKYPVSPRARPGPSPVRKPATPRDAYPIKSLQVVIVASVLLGLLTFLGVIPRFPLVPELLLFEVVRFFTFLPLSLAGFGGLGFLIGGATLAILSDRQRKGDSGKLLQYGYFGFTRNPFYLGGACVLFGMSLFFNSLFLVLLGATWVAYVHLQVLPSEEAELLEVFGPEFEFYASQVPRWALVF